LELDNVNLILGDNASGKSSVLRALAIAVLAPALLGSGGADMSIAKRMTSKAMPHAACLRAFSNIWDGDRRLANRYLDACRAYVAGETDSVPQPN